MMRSAPFFRSRGRAACVISVSALLVVVALISAGRQYAGAPSSSTHFSAGAFVPADKGGIKPDSAIIVNSLSDVANGSDGLCTLREAITAANTNTASGATAGECAAGSGADAISFSVTGTINLTGVLPDIASDMTITGPGSAQLTIQRNTAGLYRIFNVTAGTVGLSGLTVTNGKTVDGEGGAGIQNLATLTLNDLTITSNQTGGGTGGPVGGGGVHNQGTLAMTNCLVSGNSTANSNSPMPGGGVVNRGTLTMTNCIVSNNKSGDGNFVGAAGGGISNRGPLTLVGTTVTNNLTGSAGAGGFGGSGGGIFHSGPDPASLLNCTVSGNTIPTPPGGTQGQGGGIDNEGTTTMVITGTTISGNTGQSTAGAILNRNSLVITNSTVSGNHSIGIANANSIATMIATNCTVTANDSSGLDSSNSGSKVRNSIVAGNTGTDLSGTFSSQGHNFIGVPAPGFTNGVNGDQVGTVGSPLDPHLGPLANNGGPTQTHALQLSSTALDGGDNCVTDPAHCSDANISQLATDQRGAGFSRIVDGPDGDTTATVDIGAYELQVPPLADLPDTSMNEDAQLSILFDAGDPGVINSVTATSSNTILVPNDPAHLSVTMTGSVGTVTINPALNANGTTNITVTINRTGGPESKTFLLTVNPVNDVPSFAKGSDQAVNEDAGAQTVNSWASAISAGPADESAQILTFQVTGNTNPALFSAAPAISPTGTLTYTPAADKSGSATITINLKDNGGTANGGVDTSATQTFTITINSVNDPPSFTKGANQTVAEDAGAQSVVSWASNISAGPADESGQILTFTATNDNNALFSIQPAISSSGTLSYTSVANANGTATVTVTLKDNGGIANGGLDTSAPQTFTITVNSVNDAPSFTKGPDQTVSEDAGTQTVNPWATAILAGPANESGQALTFQVTGNTNAALFASGPAISPTGTLTYTPAADATGSATITLNLKDDGGTANGGVDTSASQTFTITVNAVNDAPSFTKGTDQTVNEDAGGQSIAWATAISSGPADESGQTLTFQVTGNTNAALFSAGPAISSTGTLTYTPAANASGSATITINLKDNGGTASGGVDTSASQTFTITVNPVNDAPSFTKAGNQTVNEDAGAQTVPNWATAISSGPADESAQTLTFQVTGNTNAALFSAGPAISSTGALTYTPAADANGAATLTITLKDSGGTANGGVDTSTPQSFTITLNAVNDVPSFTRGANQTVNENAGPQSVPNWATNISPGPANESGQTVTFQITGNSNPSLFSTAPAVGTNGTLTYQTAANLRGTATITIQLQDNGGTANGGVDTSAAQTFTITVEPSGGSLAFTTPTLNPTESSGSVTATVRRTGDISRPVTIDYATSADNGLPCSTANGTATPKCDFTTAAGTLSFAAGEDTKTFTILISQDSFVEGPETFTATLLNPTGGAAVGTPGTTSITITDDATEPATNPIDDVRNFVRQHYHDFLNREPDASGWDFWSNQITSCGNDVQCNEVRRIDVSASFFLSIEFQQSGYLVERFYKVAYGDATGTSNFPSNHQLAVPVVRFDEFLKDTQRIGRGVVVLAPGWEQALDSNKQAYALEFVQTARFTGANAFPTTLTPAQFVDKLNQNAGNVLSANERTAAINFFNGAADSSNTTARAQAVRQVAEDQDLYNAEFNRAFVLAEYFGYLRRNPNDAPESTLDYTGYDFWLTKLNQFNGNYINAEMVKAFLTSIEYRQRFGP